MDHQTPFQPQNQFGNSSFDWENQPAKPKNNLLLAIVGTVVGLCSPFCFPGFIAGVVAIVMATQVNTKYDAGDYLGAEKAAKNAKILSYVALGLGILGLIFSIYAIATSDVNVFSERYLEYLQQQGYDVE